MAYKVHGVHILYLLGYDCVFVVPSRAVFLNFVVSCAYDDNKVFYYYTENDLKHNFTDQINMHFFTFMISCSSQPPKQIH